MPFITKDRILQLCPHADIAIVQAVAPVLDSHLGQYGVSTLLRRAHFMGQVAYESDGFRRLEENLYYTHADRIAAVWPKLKDRAESLVRNPVALGNAAYANVLGNGDEASGDGSRFAGKSLIQLTGRANYTAWAHATGLDIVNHPELAAHPDNAAILALSYWASRGCSKPADLDDVKTVTRLINGAALAGLQDRQTLTNDAKAIFL